MTKKLSERVRNNDITLMYMDEYDWFHLDSTCLAPEIEALEMELQQARHDLMVRESKKDEKIKKLTARCDLLFEGKSCAIASIESLERQRDALLEALHKTRSALMNTIGNEQYRQIALEFAEAAIKSVEESK